MGAIGHVQHFVLYNDGTNPNVHALILHVNADDTVNLYVIPESGAPSVENGVPERAVADYGAEGGGRTWHR